MVLQLKVKAIMVAEQVQLTGKAPEGASITQYELHLGPKSKVCQAGLFGCATLPLGVP